MTYHTMTAAAGAIGVPVHIIRQVKKAGGDGFNINGSVDGVKLLRWLFTKGRDFQPVEGLEQARAKLAGARAEQIMREMELAGGAVVSLAAVRKALSDAAAGFRLDDLITSAKAAGWHLSRATSLSDEALRTAECERLLTAIMQDAVQSFRATINDVLTKVQE